MYTFTVHVKQTGQTMKHNRVFDKLIIVLIKLGFKLLSLKEVHS